MYTFVIPFIINLLIILYCIFNVNTKYNIIYIIWVIVSLIPILSWLMFVIFPIFMGKVEDSHYEPIAGLKPTKLNKFLFGYEEQKRKN